MRGQIIERRPGYYTVVVSYKDPRSGKWSKKWRAVGDSKRKAQTELTKMLTDISKGIIIKPGRVDVGEHLKTWLKDTSIQTLAKRTLENYEYNTAKYILPVLSQIHLAELTPTHISKLYSSILGPDGERIRTIQLVHVILHKSMDYAVKQGLVIRNVVDQVDPPKSKRHEMNTLNRNEILLALELAKGSVFYPMFHVAIFTGVRRGELIGLKWGDVDLLLSRISIQRSISHVVSGTNKGKIETKAPKTAKGKRLIQLSNSTVEVLREHYEKQKEFRRHLNLELTDDDYVFCNHIGKPYTPHTLSTAWHRLSKKAGIKDVRLHDLRHTFATMNLKNNINSKIVSEMLGHAGTTITADLYSHVSPIMQQEAVNKLDDLIFGSPDNSVASR